MSNQFKQVTKFTGNGAGGTTPNFGQSISISADGNCIAVGGRYDSNYVGAVWIFRKVNNRWRQEAKLVPPTGTYLTNYPPQFGTSVSINQDGSLVFIGGPNDYSRSNDYSSGYYYGGNWVFSLNSVAGVWAMQGDKLVSYEYDSDNTYQGISVAMTPDGTTAVSGSTSSNLGATVYTLVTNSWVFQGNSLRNQQGYPASTVAISADGNLILLGGSGNYISVYTRTNTVWSLQQTMTNGGSNFGTSMSLSANGNIAFIGQPTSYVNTGTAWIYKRVAGTFTQVGSYLVPQGASSGAYFGSSIACNAAGTLFAVGASYDNSGTGAVFVYSFDGTTSTKLVAGDYTGTTPQEGTSVSMSAIGDTITFGGPYDKSNFGAGWIYSNAAITAAPSFAPTAPTVAPTKLPTVVPTILPSTTPSVTPSQVPTVQPTVGPTATPTIVPSQTPTAVPTTLPSTTPTMVPTLFPTITPTVVPTALPSQAPTIVPTILPSTTPTVLPSLQPTTAPTTVPTILPSTLPTMEPTLFPTFLPTGVPNLNPTIVPSRLPSFSPSRLPTNRPSIKPSLAPIALAGAATASSLDMLSIIIIAVIGGLALMCTLLLIRYRLSRNYREADTAIGEMNEWIEDAKTNANHGSYIQLQHSSKQAKAEDPLLTDIYADNKRSDEML